MFVWYTICAGSVGGSYLFEKDNDTSITIASDRYTNMLNGHEDFQNEDIKFEQDGAIPQAAR